MREHRDFLINLNLILLAIIGSAVVLVGAYRVLHVLFPVLILLIIGMLVAFLLDPVVSRLQLAGMGRAPAVLLVFAGLLAVIFGLGGLLTVPLAHQITALAHHFPHNQKQRSHLVKEVDLWLSHHGISFKVESLQNEGTKIGQGLLGNSLKIVQTVSRIAIDVVASLVLSLYLLIDGPRIRHNILRLVPAGHRNRVLFVEVTVRTVVGGYVRGQLLLALTIGLLAAGGTFALGVHYPLVIGLAAGFFELIPMLGPILGALPAVGIAIFQGGWQLAALTIVLFIIIQQLEAHLIAPRIIGHAVGVHPIVAILAVLLGADLRGVFGALVAVPLAGIAYVLAQALYSYFTGQVQVVAVKRRRPVYVRVYLWTRSRVGRKVEEPAVEPVLVAAASDQLAEILHERDVLAEEFARAERDTMEE